MIELGEAFKKTGYPEKMIVNIRNKVLNSERDISLKDKEEPEEFDEKIIVVSTFQADEKIVSTKESEENFKQTHTEFPYKTWPLI